MGIEGIAEGEETVNDRYSAELIAAAYQHIQDGKKDAKAGIRPSWRTAPASPWKPFYDVGYRLGSIEGRQFIENCLFIHGKIASAVDGQI